MKRETWLAGVVVCGAVIALGAFLPWVTLGAFAISGVTGDGIFAIAIGAAMIVAGVAGFGGSRPAVYGVQALGGLAFALAFFEGYQLYNRTSEFTLTSVGTGILVIGVTGLIAAAGFGANAPRT